MKSHVSLEQKMCIVTGKPYDTESILLDSSLEDSMEKYTVTGWGISPEVQKLLDDGYIAIVEIDEEKSDKNETGNYSPSSVYRLGQVAYLKKKVAIDIFDQPEIPNVVWADSKLLQYLNEISK